MTVLDRFPLDELAARVAAALAQLAVEQSNGQVSAVPDARTLRYYSTLGLLDRPIEVRGRRALYGERHVLQALAIKALQAQGLALGEIQQRLTGRSDAELRAVVARPGGARFWRQAPATGDHDHGATTPAADEGAAPGAGSETDPIAVRLAPGVTLVVEAARTLRPDDLDALRRASTSLVRQLGRLGLTPDEQEPR